MERMSRSLTHLPLLRTCWLDAHYEDDHCTCLSTTDGASLQWQGIGRSYLLYNEATPAYLTSVSNPSPPLDHEHLIQYHSFHPCTTRCRVCELYVWKIWYPASQSSELGFAPREVCDEGDNTNILGAPWLCFRDVVIHRQLPILHCSLPALTVTCNCSEFDVPTALGSETPSSAPRSHRQHGHWQIVTEHHKCVVCVGRCVVTRPRGPTPVSPYNKDGVGAHLCVTKLHRQRSRLLPHWSN